MKYKTEEERKQAKREYLKQWYKANKEKIAERHKQYRQENAEKIAELNKHYYQKNKEKNAEYKKQYDKQYYSTPMGRAVRLVGSYNKADHNHNRGECTLTAQWIIDNIFSSKCIYCGESDWTKLGCDRKDNSLPHTEDNVVCSCWDCNNKRKTKSFEEFLAECKTS